MRFPQKACPWTLCVALTFSASCSSDRAGRGAGDGGADTSTSGADADAAASGGTPQGNSGGTSAGDTSGGGTRATYVAADHPDYFWDDVPPTKVPWSRIDQLNLGMLWPMQTASGFSLGMNNWDTRVADPVSSTWSATAKAYTKAGHDAGVKVLCLLGGAGGNPNPTGQPGADLFAAASDTDAHAKAFAQNIKAVLTDMGFDGVDLDWEDGSQTPEAMQRGLVRLAHQLRIVWPEAVIIIPAGAIGEDAAALAAAKDDVDAFEPMTYMDAEQWGGFLLPSPLTPLHGDIYSVDKTLAAWSRAGVPATKILLGVGGYGAAWADSNGDHRAPNKPFINVGALNSNPEGESRSMFGDNAVTQAWLTRILAANSALKEGYDEATESSYWGAPAANQLVRVEHPENPNATIELGLVLYESPRSIRAKAKYISDKKLKGMSFWTLAELLDGNASPVLEAIP